jgi:hypothetical protein
MVDPLPVILNLALTTSFFQMIADEVFGRHSMAEVSAGKSPLRLTARIVNSEKLPGKHI